MNTPARIIIVDDEPIARDILGIYIAQNPKLQLVASCANALAAIQAINNNPVDIMLLDINMPEITGMQLAKSLPHPPQVIFTTAYSEFAVASYDLNATDYLLKPIAPERFNVAIEKALQKMRDTTSQAILFIKTSQKLVRIEMLNFLYAEGLKDYVRIWTKKGPLVVHTTMKQLEQELAAYPEFLRINRSFLVNLLALENASAHAVSIAGQEIPIGITYKAHVLQMLNKHRLI